MQLLPASLAAVPSPAPASAPAPAPSFCLARNLSFDRTIILRVLAVQFSGHHCGVWCVVCPACLHSITPPHLPWLPPIPRPGPSGSCIVITIMARTIYVLILHLSGKQPAKSKLEEWHPTRRARVGSGCGLNFSLIGADNHAIDAHALVILPAVAPASKLLSN